MSDSLLDDAKGALHDGQWQLADILCRQALQTGGQVDEAQALVARIRQGVGLPEHGIPQSDARRFVLIKAWGFGFWSDLDHVLGSLLLAELTGRTPIVHWGHNSLFREPHTDNAFECFFEPVSWATMADAQAHGLSHFPHKWRADLLQQEDLNKWEGPGSRVTALSALARQEDVVVCDFHNKVNDLLPWIPVGHPLQGLSRSQVYRHLVKTHLRLKPHLTQTVSAIWSQHMAQHNWLAVHVRGTDKVHEMGNLAQVNQQYHLSIERVLQVNPGLRIFLLTDSSHTVEEFQACWGERVLCLPCQRGSGTTGVHLEGHNGVALGEQVLLDAHLAARCDYFLGNGGSNVSVGIRHLKDWDAGTYFLIGEDFLGQLDTSLHRR